MVGIKQVAVTPSENLTTIVFPVESKPWGFLVSRSNDDPIYNTTAVVSADGVWTEYGGGQYVRHGYTIRRQTGAYDHYVFGAGNIVYDDTEKTFSLTIASAEFAKDITYYLWYFTLPF